MRDLCLVFIHRLVALFHRRHLDDDLDAELRSHLEMAVELNLRRGMTAEDARREALRRFGGVDRIKEIYRSQRGLPVIETTLRDLRFGCRLLRRSPGFSLSAILCLTLGIGANIAVFSWIEGILFRPFPAVVHQERLLALSGTARGTQDSTDLSWPDFVDFQRACTQIDLIEDKIMGTTLSIGDRAERASGSIVSPNYFAALGIHPVLGRGFTADEGTGRNAHPVTVISYWTWQERFNGDPGIIGKTQVLNGLPYTIIGVAPQGFYGTFVGYAMQFWVPTSMQERFDAGGYKLEDRGARWIEGFAKLKPGVTREQAQEEISAVAKRLAAAYPATNRGRGIRLLPLWQTPFNKASELLPTLGITLAMASLVLLIACANVSNLMLVRSLARQREMTIRLAVGCGRGQLLKQLFTEGLVLSMFAAAGGLAVAYGCRNVLAMFFPAPNGVALNLRGELDWRVLAFGAGVCLVSTLLFGLIPALQTAKVDLAAALKFESGSVVGGRGRSRVRSLLILLQVSLGFVLLVGAGLLIRSVQEMRTASPGFATEDVLTTGLDLFSAGYDAQHAKNFQDELSERVRALPGVKSIAFARVRPFSYLPYSTASILVDGYQAAPDEQPAVEYNEVDPAYFATLGIPLVSGHDFATTDTEAAPLVAVVNETMVEKYWHGEDPVGKRLQVNGRWMQVIAVARNSMYWTFLETPKPFFYVPLRQNFSLRAVLHIRTSAAPETIAAALAGEIHALDGSLAPQEVITMREHIERSTSAQRIAMTVLSLFSGLALVLAVVGLYGVMSYMVSQRRRELGLRMALGASASDLLRLVMSHGLALTAGGVVLGVAAALGLTRLLGYILYKVSPRDPLAFASAFVVMTIASLAACFLPAWRAPRIDPVRALRD
ncbi:MAG TPA: ABC transporter permease [Thermoanaerobaculia bacterium]|jgi:predicted permease